MSNEDDNLKDQLSKIEQTIAAQEKLKGILSDDQIELMLAALKEKRAALQAQITGSGAVAQGEVAVAAGAHGTAISHVQGNVYVGPQLKDGAEAIAIYYRIVARAGKFLSMRGVNIDSADPTGEQNPLCLANVYVHLDTTARVPKSGKGKINNQEDFLSGGPEHKDDPPLSVLDAAINNRRLVLLGDPGSGKSTFVNHLAHCLAARAMQEDADRLKHLPGWPKNQALPIVIILRDFARTLPDPLPRVAEPNHLWDFIKARLKAQNIVLAADLLHQALQKGKAVVLLDGLDEVPGEAFRIFIREAINTFVERYCDNKYIITCRILSYQPPAVRDKPDLRLPGFPAFELSPFNPEKVDQFINAWYNELSIDGVVGLDDAPLLAQKLRAAVRRPDLWRMGLQPPSLNCYGHSAYP